MLRIMAKALRAAHLVRSFVFLCLYRLIYRQFSFGRMVEIGRGARIIIRPGGSLVIGDRVKIEPGCLVDAKGVVEIGSNSFIGQGTVIVACECIAIGQDALIAERVTIRDQNHRTDAFPYRLQSMTASPITVGQNVWIGAGAAVLKGISIGDHAIIGANAVVTKDVPERTMVVGIPAAKR